MATNRTDITFLILAFDDPEQVLRLTRRLAFHCHCIIHVSRNGDFESFRKLTWPSNVTFVENRVATNWAGWTVVEAIMQCVKMAFQLGLGEKSSHFIFLSGSDYPLRSDKDIVEFFTSQPERQFAKVIDVRKSKRHSKSVFQTFYSDVLVRRQKGLQRYKNWAMRHAARYIAFVFAPKRISPEVRIAFGSMFWGLTPDFLKTVCESFDHPGDVERLLKTAHAPDELYAQTLLANSRYFNDCGGFVPYVGDNVALYANFHVLDPAITEGRRGLAILFKGRDKNAKKWFTLEDFDYLTQQSSLFFRKVSTKESSSLLDRIDQHIDGGL